MNSEEIRNRLAVIISERVNRLISPGQVTMDSRLRDDLSIDSLTAAELMFEIQEEFGTDVNEAETLQLRTIRDLVAAIEEKRAA